jgi:hypothetical protein
MGLKVILEFYEHSCWQSTRPIAGGGISVTINLPK